MLSNTKHLVLEKKLGKGNERFYQLIGLSLFHDSMYHIEGWLPMADDSDPSIGIQMQNQIIFK